jgi:pimeloyl-ACP methyl ester carboxylesterase
LKAPVIMVHGAFCGGWAFDQFRAPFEAAGHRVIAPDLPGHGAHENGRGVAGLSMTDYVRLIVALIKELEQPPILIGHSLGGLVAQMAAARASIGGLILLAPSAPWGVALSSLEEALSAFSLYALGPFWSQAVDPDQAAARLYLLNRLPPQALRDTYARLVPESGRALFETLNWWFDPFATTLVSAARVQTAVLGVAGENDVILPPATVRATTERLGGQLIIAPGASHWLPAEPGWEATAQACLDWINGPALAAAA